MASVNKVIVVGNLGRDPEVRYSPSGVPVCNLSVATTDKRTDKNTGEVKEETEWHRISLFNRLAEIAGEYLKKGSQVYIEGRIGTSPRSLASRCRCLGPAVDPVTVSRPRVKPAEESPPKTTRHQILVTSMMTFRSEIHLNS